MTPTGDVPPREACVEGGRREGSEGGRSSGHPEQHVQQHIFLRQLRVLGDRRKVYCDASFVGVIMFSRFRFFSGGGGGGGAEGMWMVGRDGGGRGMFGFACFGLGIFHCACCLLVGLL